MDSDRFSAMNPVKGFTDRRQRTVFLGSAIGLLVNNLLMFVYVAGGDAVVNTWVTNVTYNIILGTMVYCAYANWHFVRVAVYGMLLVYGQIWVNTFIYAETNNDSLINLPVLFFAPIALVLIADYRVMSFIAVVHSTLLYLHTTTVAPHTYAAAWSAQDLANYAVSLTLLSFVSGALLAAVTFSRERTDQRVLALLAEKDRLAAEDPLTGLSNRRSFLKALGEAIEAKTPVACVFIDLDRFKPLNDKYGHAVGDSVLMAIAERLAEPNSVLLASRFGGDEFAVLIATSRLASPLNQFLEVFHEKCTADVATQVGNVGVGASLGFACYPEDSTELSELMHQADTAMRRAKGEGLAVSRFNQTVDQSTLTRSAMELAFSDALKAGQIKPALQPIACANTGNILGFEILARWVDSTLERDPAPAEFIPVAERAGLLHPLMLSTLEQSLRDHPIRTDQFYAVNVSPAQLSNPEFLADIQTLLDRYDVAPQQIELEITEQVAFRNLDYNVRILHAARARGFRVALDDFGVGYSSLSMLHNLPLDKLKIDRSFIQRVARNHANRQVLEATVSLTKKLKLKCCIEGVEDSETADYVTRLGCEQLQGHWIGPPELVGSGDRVVPLKAVGHS
ncbi:MAG: bifunctional diguanylate cyclase/phosphodiesterase [Pseudomonadota bacterium]